MNFSGIEEHTPTDKNFHSYNGNNIVMVYFKPGE